MSIKLHRFSHSAQSQLTPYFKSAGVAYPPKRLAFLVFKNTRQLQVYAADNGSWKYIKTFRLLGASGGLGPKLRSGDHQVPEGIYSITEFNPRSRYDLSLRLNYPNNFDRQYAASDQRTNLGGDIYLHGDRCSTGCLAIGNSAIRQLFPLVYYVGAKNVIVIIAPNDLRKQKPIYGAVQPNWLPLLYNQITTELRQFR